MNRMDGAPPDITLNQSMTLLGWGWIQHALAGQAMSPVTRSRLEACTPETDFDTAQRLLTETAEMVSLFDNVDTLPLRSFQDLTPVLESVRERLLVEAEQCLQVVDF